MSEDIRRSLAKEEPMITLRVAALQIALVRIPPGEFMMGSPPNEEGHGRNEEPQRRVRISQGFYLGKYQITLAEYDEVMGNTPRDGAEHLLPVSQITYENAIEFCARLSTAAKLKISLPTEAQWEYACRAGTETRYYSGDTEADLARVGWYSKNSEGKTHQVGGKQPNAWGLYDMHGNVWEFCADFIEDYATMPDIDPIGAITPRHGAMRGGGWMHDAEECRSATRLISDDMFGGAGLRIALKISEQSLN